jgi:hypothetical protein
MGGESMRQRCLDSMRSTPAFDVFIFPVIYFRLSRNEFHLTHASSLSPDHEA